MGALHLAERATSELSAGELQRICLAAAVALRPRLLLLDEPTSQLDPDGADAFLACVEELGAAVVLSEQRVARALDVADRVLFVDGGRLAPRRATQRGNLVARGTPARVCAAGSLPSLPRWRRPTMLSE